LLRNPLRQFAGDGAFAASAVEVAGGTLKADLVDGAQVAEASELQEPWPFSWAIGADCACKKSRAVAITSNERLIVTIGRCYALAADDDKSARRGTGEPRLGAEGSVGLCSSLRYGRAGQARVALRGPSSSRSGSLRSLGCLSIARPS
jgi:hypothetical protein